MRKTLLGWIRVSTLAVFTVLASVSLVSADQGFYVIDKSIRTGMLVSLSPNPEVVKPATTEDAANLVGVVGEGSTSLSSNPDQINVRTEGVANALVSTIDGDIKVGDSITASHLVGLGSKLKGNGWIVGTAQASLDAGTSGAIKSTISDTTGKQHEVYVGNIPVLIKVMYYNTQSSSEDSRSIIPEKLQTTIDSLAGRRASQIAVVLAFIILLSGFIISGLIAYTAISQAIKATARQPLAKQPIVRRMIQSCAISMVILLAAIVSASIVVRIL